MKFTLPVYSFASGFYFRRRAISTTQDFKFIKKDVVIFFIIWGTKWKYNRKPDGVIIYKVCPNCQKGGEFFEVIPVKYFSLYWIPLIPLEKKNPLLECPNCHERFYTQPSDYNRGTGS